MGVKQSFSKELEKAPACRITIEQQAFCAARLAGFLQGSNAAVVLKPSVYLTAGGWCVSHDRQEIRSGRPITEICSPTKNRCPR